MSSTRMKITTLFLSSLLLLAMLATSLPQSALAAPADVAYPTECSDTYTVKPGDTIYKVARIFKVKVWELAKANELTKPYLLTPGTKLCIPEQYTPPSKLKLSIVVKSGKITITGKNFPDSRKYYVRIRPTGTFNAWTKLGWTASDSKGNISATFLVPPALKNTLYVTVCLKDSVSNFPYCRSVLNVP